LDLPGLGWIGGDSSGFFWGKDFNREADDRQQTRMNANKNGLMGHDMVGRVSPSAPGNRAFPLSRISWFAVKMPFLPFDWAGS